jgi:homoserine O-acetyltransferase/O-succinyltransferase
MYYWYSNGPRPLARRGIAQTDRSFDVRDNEDEIGRLVNARSAVLHPIPSIHGHRAGNPVNIAADRAFINAEISALLQS